MSELGIEFDPEAKKADLEALLAEEDTSSEETSSEESREETTPSQGETEEGLESEEDSSKPEDDGFKAPDEPTIETNSGGAVDIVDGYGTYIRTFEASRHDEAYKGQYIDRAKEFVGQPENQVRGYQIVPASAYRSVRN